MSQATNTGLSDREYDILRTLGKDADFLYDKINTYKMLKKMEDKI